MQYFKIENKIQEVKKFAATGMDDVKKNWTCYT